MVRSFSGQKYADIQVNVADTGGGILAWESASASKDFPYCRHQAG